MPPWFRWHMITKRDATGKPAAAIGKDVLTAVNGDDALLANDFVVI